jgi:hypothetical protein
MVMSEYLPPECLRSFTGIELTREATCNVRKLSMFGRIKTSRSNVTLDATIGTWIRRATADEFRCTTSTGIPMIVSIWVLSFHAMSLTIDRQPGM